MKHLKPVARRSAVLLISSTLFCAAMPAFSLEPEVPASGSFVSGGIGQEGRQAMHVLRQQYNLRLSFVELRTGAFISGVSLSLERLKPPAAVGTFEDAGPLFYMKLEPGVYRVTATNAGIAKAATIRVGRIGVDKVFYWPEEKNR